jgi:hypothetical protein
VLFYDGFGKDWEAKATASNNLVYATVITKNGMIPGGPDGPGGGIVVSFGTGNRLIANQIYDNAAWAINNMFHDGDGIDENDLFDADTGGNNRQNYPDLETTFTSTGRTVVRGALHSAPSGSYTLLFYANAACDPLGHGEAEHFVGGVMADTDSSGNASFEAALNLLVPSGATLTATAMDAEGSTSELSACLVVR